MLVGSDIEILGNILQCFLLHCSKQNAAIRFLLQTLALHHVSSGLCLSTGPDEALVLQACSGLIGQQWQLEAVPWK
jgi:hypothetical protein